MHQLSERPRAIRAALLLAAASSITLASGILCADAPAQVGILEGRVIDDASEEPISGATLTLLDGRGRSHATVLGNDEGRFVFRNLREGEHRLRATRIGYATVTTPPFPMPADTLHVELRMDQEAVPLAPLEVVAGPYRPAPTPGLEGFRFRRERGLGGSFITREQIERRSASRVTQVLQEAGLAVHDGSESLVSRRMGCEPHVYIDGMRVTREFGGDRIDAWMMANMVHPSSVEGIEVYQSASQVPAEFGGSLAQCGAVVIWTRRGLPPE